MSEESRDGEETSPSAGGSSVSEATPASSSSAAVRRRSTPDVSRSQNSSPLPSSSPPEVAGLEKTPPVHHSNHHVQTHSAPRRLFNSAAAERQRMPDKNQSHHSSSPHAAFRPDDKTSNGAMAGHNSRRSTDSDCGSEFTRSFDELSVVGHLRSDSKTEGSIKLNIPNVSNLRAKVNTSFHTIANLPWRLAAKTECSKRTSNVKFFSVYIDCNPESESTLWSCEAVVEFRLIAQKPDTASFSRQFTNKFNYNSNNWGFPSFMEWSEILNPEKGFIRGDRVVVEAHITVQKVAGVRKNPTFDFRMPSANTSDGILVVDGIRLHISKAYLALYSPVFNAMFFSNFQERDKKEIPVEDVIFEEFLELLHVVYPSHKPVSAENVEFLLELGDKFEIQYVIDECERFLCTSDDIAVVTKLVWADQYCLAKLQDVCVRTFKSVADIKQLKNSEEYKNLSDTTKAALLEKIFKLFKD